MGWLNRLLCPSVDWPSQTAIFGFMNSLVDIKGISAIFLFPVKGATSDNISQDSNLILRTRFIAFQAVGTSINGTHSLLLGANLAALKV